MTNLTVTTIKKGLANPSWSITFGDEEFQCFNLVTSRKLTNTKTECGHGIFNESYEEVSFTREDTTVEVDFGSVWSLSDYDNPAQEIKRRIDLVNSAFREASLSYKKSWSVDVYSDNDYI